MLGAFLAAGMLGSVLGVVLGGVIAEHWGWQAGFGAVGIPGLFLAVVFLLLVRDYKTVALPPRERADGGLKARGTRRDRRTAAGRARRSSPVLARDSICSSCPTIWAWLPSYFNRYYGLAPDKAGVKTAVVVLVGGVGALVWSMVADRLSARIPRARLLVPAATAVLTTVFMCVAFAGLAPGNAQFALIVAGGRDGRQRGSDRRRRDRRHPPGAARDRGSRSCR